MHKVKVIAEEKPDLLKDIDSGKKTVNSAYTLLKREKKLREFHTKENPLPNGKFNLVYADPLHKVRDKAVEDGQRMGEALLWAEAKMGELLKAIPKEESYTGFQQRKAVLLEGITHKQSHYAQILADNPDVIEEVNPD